MSNTLKMRVLEGVALRAIYVMEATEINYDIQKCCVVSDAWDDSQIRKITKNVNY